MNPNFGSRRIIYKEYSKILEYKQGHLAIVRYQKQENSGSTIQFEIELISLEIIQLEQELQRSTCFTEFRTKGMRLQGLKNRKNILQNLLRRNSSENDESV